MRVRVLNRVSDADTPLRCFKSYRIVQSTVKNQRLKTVNTLSAVTMGVKRDIIARLL